MTTNDPYRAGQKAHARSMRGTTQWWVEAQEEGSFTWEAVTTPGEKRDEQVWAMRALEKSERDRAGPRRTFRLRYATFDAEGTLQ